MGNHDPYSDSAGAGGHRNREQFAPRALAEARRLLGFEAMSRPDCGAGFALQKFTTFFRHRLNRS